MEQVLITDRSHLFGKEDAPQGFISGANADLLARIRSGMRFEDRGPVETQPEKKQIIPYIVVRRGDLFFMLKRLAGQTEARLHHKVSIGTGGHINPVDSDSEEDLLTAGMMRELNEELHITGRCVLRHLGFVNDDSNDVGKVHLGIVMDLEVFENHVSVRETDLMEGRFVSFQELKTEFSNMETWSQLILPYLQNADRDLDGKEIIL